LYRLLRSQYKDFHKRHRSSERTIQGLEGEIKSLRSRIEQLEGEIEEIGQNGGGASLGGQHACLRKTIGL
jgi:septal ring factor EnvC (AmiA/AmiB activator)